MKFNDFSLAIYKLYPNVTVIRGDTAYDSEGNEVAYDKEAVQAYVDSQAYIAKRQAAYPPASDYLDAVVKGDQVAIDKYVADCLAVKARFPK